MIVLIVFELWTSLRFDPSTKTKTCSSAPTALPAGAWEFPSFSTFAVVASLEIQENQIKMIMIKNRKFLMIFGLAVLIKSGITVLTKRLVFAVVLVCASVFWVVETQNFHDVSSVPIGPIWTEFIGRPCCQFIMFICIYCIYTYIYIHNHIYGPENDGKVFLGCCRWCPTVLSIRGLWILYILYWSIYYYI